jgi:alkaline phosphatase D
VDDALTRRQLVGTAGLGAGALILGGVPVDGWARAARSRAAAPPLASGAVFDLGVSAGAPKPRGAILWTRIAGQTGDVRLGLEVARDKDFKNVVERRDVVARADDDHTVRARVEGRKVLAPDTPYWYRFRSGGGSSPVGRFKTLPPPDSRVPITVAYFSCQDWQAGYFGAHRAIAALGDDVDLVVCLGDYIYERNFYDGPRKDTLGANHDGEVETLDEYRAKYRMYKADPDLQAMHAQYAYIPIWDDHEVEDNYTADLPGEETQQVRVPFKQRRANAYRAFADFHPQQFVGSGSTRIYRSFRIGRNVDLFLLDQRQYREDQPCGDSLTTPCPEAETTPRKYLGTEQLGWLKGGLRASGGVWKLVGNQLMIMSLDIVAGAGLSNKDSWDGYGVERKDLLGYIRETGVANVSFLTGDVHTFFAGDVGLNGRGPDSVATEFVGGSVTSLGLPETISATAGGVVPPEILAALSPAVLAQNNPHYRFVDVVNRGFAVLTAGPKELRVEYKGVDARNHATAATSLAKFAVLSGDPRVHRV